MTTVTVQGSPRIIQQQSERGPSVASLSLANGERKERNSSISSSPSPSRKRLLPTSLNIDEGAPPPNKRIHTPTKEEKESIMREKAILYRRLAEAEKNPFLPTIFPFLPFNTAVGKISSVPPLYTLLQQQSPPRPPSSSVPSPYSLSGGLGTAVNVTPVAGQPGSVVNSSLGITGLPTPGGSSVGSVSTPPRASYPSPFYPALVKYPFSPPTPSSLSGISSLFSPFNANGEAQVNTSSTGGAAAGGGTTAKILASSTPKESGAAAEKGNGQKESKSKTQKNCGIPSAAHVVNGTWQTPGAISGSVQSPLSYIHPSPVSPMMFIPSPAYLGPNSVSSNISVSSSSGCSSSSETTANAAMDGSDAGPAEYDSLRAPTSQRKRYAPSEYHVGPHRPFSEKVVEEDDQSEGADNSGRNSPVDMENVSDSTVNPGDLSRVAHNLMLSTSAAASSQFNGGATVLTSGAVGGQPTADAGYIQPVQQAHSQGHTQTFYPPSVETLRSSSIAHQGYCHSVERPSSGVSSMSSSVSSRGSTPEPDDLKPDPSQMPQGSDTFCLVPGRLSLLSSTQKYKVTVDEVRRRLSHPECLNASVLGGILRRAKSKNGGHVLRQRLESIGVSLPPGRRKATELSLLTSLVEGESLHLATDFRRLCNNFFPHSELAQIIARQHAGTPEAQHRISMVKATHLIVSELQAMLNAVGGPSNIRPNDPNNPYPGLTNFGLVTHGFGNPAINTSLNVLQTYLQELLAYYEGRKPIPPPDSGRYGFNAGTGTTPQTQPNANAELQQNLHGNAYHHHHQSEGGTPSTSRAPLSSSDVAITGETRSRELVISNVGMVLKQEPADPTSG